MDENTLHKCGHDKRQEVNLEEERKTLFTHYLILNRLGCYLLIYMVLYCSIFYCVFLQQHIGFKIGLKAYCIHIN